MATEAKRTPIRVIDVDQMRSQFAVLEARQAVLTRDGQKLLARIRPSSKYFGQGDQDALFPICISPGVEYIVQGGPGGQYRLCDVDLFAVFDEEKPPIQITSPN